MKKHKPQEQLKKAQKKTFKNTKNSKKTFKNTKKHLNLQKSKNHKNPKTLKTP